MRGSFVALVLLGGCTLGRLDGLTGGSGIDANDAGVLEAGVDAAVMPDAGQPADGGGDAGVGVVLLSDSFADADSCNDSSFNSDLATSPKGRTDGHACKVCGQNASADSFSYDIGVTGTSPAIGTHFHATAWYRNPAAGATASNVTLALRSLIPTPFHQIEIGTAFGTTGSDWKRIDTDLVITKPAEAVDVFLGAPYGAGVCFVLDDLEVTIVQ